VEVFEGKAEEFELVHERWRKDPRRAEGVAQAEVEEPSFFDSGIFLRRLASKGSRACMPPEGAPSKARWRPAWTPQGVSYDETKSLQIPSCASSRRWSRGGVAQQRV
jgi:hypothetical protein